MRALGLFAVLAFAKVLTLSGREVELGAWTIPAFFWQDAAVAIAFGAMDRILRRAWVGWTLYVLLVGYAALNVALVNVLSTPLTLPMLRATRGALGDSIRHYLTAENLFLMAVVATVGWFVARILHTREVERIKASSVKIPRKPGPVRWIAMSCVIALVVLGPVASARVDTRGLHRNPLVALISSALPRVAPRHYEGDWRRSPFDSPPGEDLTRLRGSARGRNVLLISLESTGAQYLKPYGAARNPMPNLTALARESIFFEHACAVYPESIKGLFSTLCSRFPAFGETPEVHAEANAPSLASVLDAAGYRTAVFHSGRFDYLGMDAIVEACRFTIREDAGAIGGNRQSSFGVDEPATVARMLDWLDSLPPGEPFFLTYLPIAGHHPYDAPPGGPFPAADEFGCYLNSLHYGDAALGGFIAGLKARGVFENTVIVIHGDHGEAFGQHAGNHGHTLFIHEENIHVPLFVVAPGLIAEQLRVRRTASLVDLAPTVTDLLGIAPPSRWQGSSLLEPETRVALFFTDYSLGLLGLRDGAWKFTLELDSGRMKLFDLQTDPDERQNLALAMFARASAYRDHVKRWAATQRAIVLDGVQ